MEREVKGESAEWAELRAKLFGLLDRLHEQREREERKHGMKVSVSVRIIGRKKKKNQKGLIRI